MLLCAWVCLEDEREDVIVQRLEGMGIADEFQARCCGVCWDEGVETGFGCGAARESGCSRVLRGITRQLSGWDN